MHQHLIHFTSDESALLHEQYKMLLTQLNEGEGLYGAYLSALKLTMQSVLEKEELKVFWKEVQKNPRQYYHLHLVTKEKELLNLPWQLAVDERKYPFVYISKGTLPLRSADKLKALPGPLKILFMISSPEDSDIHHRLSYEQEEELILKALSPLLEASEVQLDFTENGSLEELERKLESEHYHILYFSGHGSYKNNAGYLLLEDDESLQQKLVKAELLGQTLLRKPEHTPPLVILSSCQTADGNSEDGFRGVADELVYIGVPAVIGMAFSVMDHYAIVFAAELFKQLAKKTPLVIAYGKALQEMQQEEQTRLNKSKQDDAATQWLIPQFYCNQPVDHLADWEKTDNSLKATDATTNFIKNDRFLFKPHQPGYQFIGRRRETARIFKELLQSNPILLKGQGGIGKTSMAEHLVKRLIIRDPTYHCFAFNETTIGIDHMISQLKGFLENEHQYDCSAGLERLDKGKEKFHFLLNKVCKWCKPVWVFDNMESCQENPGGHLKEEYEEWFNVLEVFLLQQFPVIFTGRYGIGELENVVELNIQEVNFIDFYRKSLQLHFRAIHHFNPSLTLPTTVELLYTALGGSYRALELFDEIYKNKPGHIQGLLEKIQRYGEQSKQTEGIVKKLTNEVREKLANDTQKLVFEELLQVLDNTEVYTLQLLSHFTRPVTLEALKVQNGNLDFKKTIKRLCDLTLIEEHQHQTGQDETALNYYYLPPLVRDWLENMSLAGIEFNDDKAGEYFFSATENFIESFSEAFRYFAKANNIEKLHEVGIGICNFFTERALPRQVLYYGSFVESKMKSNTDVTILNNLGSANQTLGEIDKALEYFEKAHFISRDKKDKQLEATALHNIGFWHQSRGHLNQALDYYEQSLAIKEKLDNPGKKDATLSNIGQIHQSKGNLHKALDYTTRSLEITKAAKNYFGEAVASGNLGIIYYQLGNPNLGIETCKKSLSIVEDIENYEGQVSALFNLGMIYKESYKFKDAIDSFEKALFLARKSGNKSGEAKALNAVGPIYEMDNDREKALEYFNKSLDLNVLIKDLPGEAASLHNLAQSYFNAGESQRGKEYIRRSQKIFIKIGDVSGQANCKNSLGAYYLYNKKDYDRALRYFNDALLLNEKTGNLIFEATTLANIGYTYRGQKNNKKALEYFQRSIDLKLRFNHYAAAGELFYIKSRIAHRDRHFSGSTKDLAKAFSYFDKANDYKGICKTGVGLSGILIEYSTEPDVKDLVNDPEFMSIIPAADSLVKSAVQILHRCEFISLNNGGILITQINELLDKAGNL